MDFIDELYTVSINSKITLKQSIEVFYDQCYMNTVMNIQN